MTASQDSGRDSGPVRFEATLHAVERPDRPGDQAGLAAVDDFDLDRIPDPEGGVRLIVSLDEVVRLLDAGFEVHLTRTLVPQPLDPALIADDDTARAWFDERIRPVRDRAAGEGAT
jgi:hypothetical protein